MGSEMPARSPTTASGCWRGDIRSLLGRSVARSKAGQLLNDENFTVDGMLLGESHKAYRPVRSCAQEQFLHGIRWKLIHAAAFRSFV
jgi:hypothetical protein